MAMSKTRKWNALGLIVLMLAGTAIAFWPFFAASKKMQGFCAELGVGMPFADVRLRAEDRGYDVSPLAGGHAVVDDPQAFGRLKCDLQFGAQEQLTSIRFNDD